MISCRKRYRALAAGQTANWDQQRSRGRTGVREGGNEAQALPRGFWPRTEQAQTQLLSHRHGDVLTQGCSAQGCLHAGMFGHKDAELQGCLGDSGRVLSTAPCTSSGSQAVLWLPGCRDPQPPSSPLSGTPHVTPSGRHNTTHHISLGPTLRELTLPDRGKSTSAEHKVTHSRKSPGRSLSCSQEITHEPVLGAHLSSLQNCCLTAERNRVILPKGSQICFGDDRRPLCTRKHVRKAVLGGMRQEKLRSL